VTSLAVEKIAELNQVLDAIGRVAVAVSGGVDSLTLACAAHLRLGADAVMFHAVSPAVPPEASERTRRHAARFGWKLEVIDAGEFADPEYLRNPANRCFYCKTNLYAAIARGSQGTIVSGTNFDDLADFRPGLEAAKKYHVRHPYVEVGIGKSLVREIAATFGLGEAADLPASPCLSSRIETGIRVTTDTLALVHAVERLVSRSLEVATVRCRIRSNGLIVELDGPAYERVMAEDNPGLRSEIERLGTDHGYAGTAQFALYRMGSAFLRT